MDRLPTVTPLPSRPEAPPAGRFGPGARRRLATLVVGPCWAIPLLLLAGCDQGGGGAPSAPGREPGGGRVVAVPAERQKANLEAFCDDQPEGVALSSAMSSVPGAGRALPSGKPTWVNVWATWCEPCKEELPFVWSLQDEVPFAGGGSRGPGKDYGIVFLSVDDDDDKVAAFRAENPRMPESLRVDPGAPFEAVMTALGQPKDTSIPVQVFADAGGQVRCIRRGAVEPHHVSTIAALLRGGT